MHFAQDFREESDTFLFTISRWHPVYDLAYYSAGTKLLLSLMGNGKRLLKIHTLNEYSKLSIGKSFVRTQESGAEGRAPKFDRLKIMLTWCWQYKLITPTQEYNFAAVLSI